MYKRQWKRRAPQACAAVWRTRSTEEIHAWFKYPPTMHCSLLCLCSCARVKRGTQTASCAYANQRDASAPYTIAASVAAILFFIFLGLCANDWLLARSRAHARLSPCNGVSSISRASARSRVYTCVCMYICRAAHTFGSAGLRWECACAIPPSRDNHHGSCPQ